MMLEQYKIRVRVNKDTKWKKCGEVGMIYQVMEDTVAVIFGMTCINMLREDLDIIGYEN